MGQLRWPLFAQCGQVKSRTGCGQNMGGWASAKLLLGLYGHFLATERTGFLDAIGGSEGRG